MNIRLGAREASVGRLSKQRVWLVYAVVSVITGGSLFDIVTDTEHWPFSQYAMYSWVNRDYSLTLTRLFGVIKSDPPREIPLTTFQYLQPFNSYRLRRALNWMLQSANREQLLGDALRDVLRRYEERRLAGQHDGPALQGVKLYRLYWKLDPWARNIDRPDGKNLIFAVTPPVEEKR